MEVIREIKLNNSHGLHARPASLFVRLAKKYKSNVHVESRGRKVSGKNILGLILLGLCQGESIKIIAHGEDSDKAMDALSNLVENGFILS